jgi:hypothetical protein
LSQGKNIHFDEEERAKEEWIEVKVTVVTEEVFQSLKKAEQLKHNITRNK